nr:immunoglobulin heavy chain junction region [Macaca mulatta]
CASPLLPTTGNW